ncbi:MAG: hypothetical protein IKX46_04410, partial [Verrucomicrobia bacterium]|nr:hypothetical protein [Verrucomicrobiota bacterium]
MNKNIIFAILFVTASVLFALPVCGQDALTTTWTREGYFTDEFGNFLSVTYSDLEGYEGWMVGCILGEEMYGDLVEEVGDTLYGDLVPDYEEGEFIVTVCEEGEDGLLLITESGDTFHFVPWEIEEASISVTVNTEGMGSYLLADGESTEWADDGFPFSSSVFNLNEPEIHTFFAQPWEGCSFIKWTKDGMDYSYDPQITVEMNESADFVAVFDWGLPVEEEGINYLVLVNKLNPLPDDWEDKLETVHMTNSLGDDVEVEKFAYEAYLRLK